MSGHNIGDPPTENPDGIWLSRKEVDFITSILVKLPFEVAAPIIKILGQKLMESRNGN